MNVLWLWKCESFIFMHFHMNFIEVFVVMSTITILYMKCYIHSDLYMCKFLQ
jgi:Ca2+-dependent lipid-binding protein